MIAPTVAQVRAYLENLHWHRGETSPDGTVWWQYPTQGGWHLVIPNWSDDDTRLLAHATVIHVIAEATGRTVEQAVADILVDQEDFAGCSRRCCPSSKPPAEWRHTLRWGDCDKAEKPPVKPASLDIPVTWTADDGYPAAGWESVLVALFAPWAGYLPPEDQHSMLAEVATTEPELRPGIVAAWQRIAEQLANPQRREVLLGDHDPAEFVEAPRPGGATASIPSRAEVEAGVSDV